MWNTYEAIVTNWTEYAQNMHVDYMPAAEQDGAGL